MTCQKVTGGTLKLTHFVTLQSFAVLDSFSATCNSRTYAFGQIVGMSIRCISTVWHRSVTWRSLCILSFRKHLGYDVESCCENTTRLQGGPKK